MRSRSTRNRSQQPNEVFLDFTSSVGFDCRLWKHDIAGSIAHANALKNARVISKSELDQIVGCLKDLAHDIENGTMQFDPKLEDIHMNIEKQLIDAIGETGKKLHTGRSRNDQIALDMRLMAREALLDISISALAFQSELLKRANESMGIVLPGVTHLQHAQPVLLSHHLLAHFWKIQRDVDRLHDCYLRTNISPLGSGALAGTTFKIDRLVAQRLLGMTALTENSLDAVSDRDFAAEAAFALTLLMIHLSSLSEEIILWSSQEYGFVTLPKELSSGSSMMPQKRNPDLPELVRGKSGRAVGDLVAILTLLKSLPLAYNRDLQEDKESLFDVIDTAEASLRALTHFLHELKFDKERMRISAEAGLLTATDLADFLTSRGIPFRTAHGMVKEIAERSKGDNGKFMLLAERMIREELKDYNTADLRILSVKNAVDRRNIEGGTGGPAVAKQMKKAGAVMERNSSRNDKMKMQVAKVDKLLM